MRATTCLAALFFIGCGETTDKNAESGTTSEEGVGTTESDDGGDGGAGSDDGGAGSDDGTGDDGTGDDGTGDDGTTTTDDNLSDVNAFSQAGCDLMDAEATSLAMGASQSEAGTAVIVPDNESSWLLQMPASGDGWFTVEVPDWMTVVHFFTNEGVELEIMGGEPFSEVLVNGACPDAGISDQRWAFHEWGSYTVRVPEGAPAEVWFTLVKE